MTTTRPRASEASAPSLTITVAVLAAGPALLDPLQDRLVALSERDVRWRVEPATAGTAEPHLVLAHGAGHVRSARRRWPAAAVIGLVPTVDDGTGALAAMDAGAIVCVRGIDAGLVAAYIRSVARRRGLLGLAVPA